jgi:hypothetical protein
MESGATCGLPAWMLSAACATFVLGPPLIATDALLELRALLGALPSDPKCGKASLKRRAKRGFRAKIDEHPDPLCNNTI